MQKRSFYLFILNAVVRVPLSFYYLPISMECYKNIELLKTPYKNQTRKNHENQNRNHIFDIDINFWLF